MITIEDLKDLMITTQKHLGKQKWVDLTLDTQEHIALPRILSKKKVQYSGGTAIQWNVKVSYVDSARNVGPYAVDSANVGDGQITAEIPWRHTTANYGIDRLEIAMNSGDIAKQIVNLVELRRADRTISLAELAEKDFWGKPADSNDKVTPFGLKYWCVSDPTVSTGEFTGGVASGFPAGPAGVSPVTYPRWRNWQDSYTNINSTDLFAKWRKAATFTRFKSPVKHQDYNKGDNYAYYTNYEVLGEIERMLEQRNDNLGADLAKYDGMAMFRRTPVDWVPYLENDEDDPIYGINWGVFYPVFLRGEYMHEDEPKAAPLQHTVLVSHVDCTWNYKCTDRRRLFVLVRHQ